MPRTTITPTQLGGGSTVGVGFTEFAWAASDATNFNQFLSTGKEMLFAYNSGATTRKLTLYKTSGNIEKDIPAGDYYCAGQIPSPGFKQTDTYVYVDGAHAELLLAVLLLP